MARGARTAQITLSLLSATAGATFVWLLLTFLFGRIYCSTACPVGFFSDLVFTLSRRYGPLRHKQFSYRPHAPYATHVLILYLVALAFSISVIPFLIEPWNMARNVASTINRGAIQDTWGSLHYIGTGAFAGITAGVISGAVTLVVLIFLAARGGRTFCTRFCPLGTAMGLLGDRTMFHLEVDPDKCISCGKCENNCRAQCVKSVTRYIDNSRCVRCFECIAHCPAEAIRFQRNRNRPATPLFRRKAKT